MSLQPVAMTAPPPVVTGVREVTQPLVQTTTVSVDPHSVPNPVRSTKHKHMALIGSIIAISIAAIAGVVVIQEGKKLVTNEKPQAQVIVRDEVSGHSSPMRVASSLFYINLAIYVLSTLIELRGGFGNQTIHHGAAVVEFITFVVLIGFTIAGMVTGMKSYVLIGTFFCILGGFRYAAVFTGTNISKHFGKLKEEADNISGANQMSEVIRLGGTELQQQEGQPSNPDQTEFGQQTQTKV